MIAIPNMEKPKSCDKCPIRIAELFGVYYDSKDGKSKRIKITGCDSSKYNGNTLAEEEKMMYEHCPLIDIVRCKDCKYWHDHKWSSTCDKHIGNGFPSDYFCKDGERRSDE